MECETDGCNAASAAGDGAPEWRLCEPLQPWTSSAGAHVPLTNWHWQAADRLRLALAKTLPILCRVVNGAQFSQ